jgi:hypothetical protein
MEGTSKRAAEWVDTKIQSQKILHAEMPSSVPSTPPSQHSYKRNEYARKEASIIFLAACLSICIICGNEYVLSTSSLWVRDKGWGCVCHQCHNITIIDTVWLKVRCRQGESMPNAQWCHCMGWIELDGSSCKQYNFYRCF